jgi:membrane protein required for colicin V production
MNGFDAVVSIALMAAVVAGFRAGLLRSTATIIGYVAAMPIAGMAMRFISAGPIDKSQPPWGQDAVAFFVAFLVAGIVLGTLLRTAVSETVGPDIGLADRFAGAALGAVRIGLVALALVVVYDRVIPPDRESPFLQGSRLRPILSIVGQKSLKSLPPDVTEFVDHLKAGRA